ncbi:MAG: hypothetical protein CTY18_03700 [Methylomonas sp.]|nr:MAG: hypothetical protein CTY18_03700 [Methylomonas sp.]
MQDLTPIFFQLALNGGDFSNIDLTSIGVSAALGAVGNVAGGNAARSFLGGLKGTRTKELIGEFGAAIKGIGQGRIPPIFKDARQVRIDLSKSFTKVDQVQKSIFTGKNTFVEAKFSTSGRPSLTGPQRLARRELPARGLDYRVVTTTASEFINAGRLAGSIAGGVTGSALISSINTTLDSINSQITPPILGNISVDFLGFGDDVGAANGGFVLYPNKPNNNTAQAVYRK